MFTGNVSTIANLKSPKELRLQLAERARELRLTRNMRQTDLAERSGVTLASVRRFEKEGEVSLKNFAALVAASDTPKPPAFAILLTDFNGTPVHFFPDASFSAMISN